ncbi:FRG domain-containing protein [Rhizobium ruizarguesonis]
MKKIIVAEDLIAEDVISYLDKIFGIPVRSGNVRCYRGQANKSWNLKPSVMRNLKENAESQIFSELMLEAPVEFSSDKSMFDKLVRAQHYGLPTRLLDVSLNPLVGLYFACSEEEHHHVDANVQIFDFPAARVKFADSDTVSLICNLARLSDPEQREIVELYNDVQEWDGLAKEEFRQEASMKRLTQFVRVEKPYFLDAAEPLDLFKYFFVYPAKNNRRVIAQSGAFIAAGLLQYRSAMRTRSFKMRRIVIPAIKKGIIIKQLDTININSRTMFPEVEFASKYIQRKWSIG